MPSSADIKKTKVWAELDSVVDVREHYKMNGADPTIQRIVSLENRKFGSVIEKILRKSLRSQSQNLLATMLSSVDLAGLIPKSRSRLLGFGPVRKL